MVKRYSDDFGEVLDSCVFHRTIITCKDHKQFCLKSAKMLGNTSGYWSATGYSFRICKGQSTSCRGTKGVKTSPHSFLNATKMPPLSFFFFFKRAKKKKNHHIWGNTFSKSHLNLLTKELLLNCPLSTYHLLIYLNFCFQSTFLQIQNHKIRSILNSTILLLVSDVKYKGLLLGQV